TDLGADLGVAKVKFNDADPGTPEFNADFGLDLKVDGTGHFSIDPTLTGTAGLDLHFKTTDVLDGILPDMSGDFSVSFGIENNEFTAPAVGVDHLKVDLGSYVGIVGSTFTDLGKLFNSGPLGDLVDVALQPIPALDGLAHTFG